MDQAMLKELGIMAMGEALSILKQAKETSTQTIYAKTPSAKLPQLHFEMISQHLLVMAHAQQLNLPPNKLHIHHHTFYRQEFLKLCVCYYHITGQT